MKIHEFFAKYANTPMEDRFAPFVYKTIGDKAYYISLDSIHVKILELQSEPWAICAVEELLKIADMYFSSK